MTQHLELLSTPEDRAVFISETALAVAYAARVVSMADKGKPDALSFAVANRMRMAALTTRAILAEEQPKSQSDAQPAEADIDTSDATVTSPPASPIRHPKTLF